MSKFSVREPLTIFVAALAVIILGVVAFLKMTPDLLPNMDFPYVVIMTVYAGASPESVEAEVTKPMEQAMATLEHIKNLSSISRDSYSVVILEFEDSVNLDTIGVDIQQNIVSLSGQWGDGVSTPYVMKINPSLLPVEVVAVSMEGMETAELSDFMSDMILPKLEGVSGVARISTIGSVTREVHVVIDQDKIDSVNAKLADAVNQQLNDTAAELEETKAELEEAKQQLEEAQAELASGRDTLVDQTASAEAYISQQTIAALQGRMELQQQLVTLNDTISQLETTLKIVRPIYGRLQSVEATEAEQSARVSALEEASARLEAADAELQVFLDRIAELEAAQEAAPEAETSESGPAEDLDEPSEDGAASEENAESVEDAEFDEPGTESAPGRDYDAEIAAIYASDEYRAAVEEVAAAEAELAELGADRYSLGVDTVTARADLAVTQAELTAIDAALELLKLNREGLGDTVAQMEDGLVQAVNGAALLENALDQLDAGTMQLSEAMGTLSTARSEGLLQLANAAAQISLNAGTLDSALLQVDSGLDSIEDTRESALASADMSGSITMSTVSSILTAQNFSMPAGYISQDGVSYMVSVGDEITDVDELEELMLFDTGEDGIGPIRLADVAEIFVTDNADETYARLDGDTGLMLTFEKQSNAATAAVTDALSERFAQLEDDYPGLQFVPLMSQGDYIYLIVRTILESLGYGAIFAILVLLLFLRDIRPTFITLVSIPISVVFAVVLMYFTGVTINMISLSGLAVSVGMLVDNSIVVIENIYRLRYKGATAVQAAVAGTKQVAGAITASTLTTVCVFLPIVFVEGITRQLFTDLALTMGYSLMASLIVALTLVPAMSRGMLKNLRESRWKGTGAPGEGRFYRGYRQAVTWSLRHKWIVLPAALILLAATVTMAVSRGFSFMPELDTNTVSVTITMPEDCTREEAVAIADEALARMQTVDHVQTVGAMMGGSGMLAMDSGSYDVTAYAILPEGFSGAEAGRTIQALCSDLDCTVTSDSAVMDMSYLSGSGVSIYVYGSDMLSLQEAAVEIAEALADVPGLKDVDPGLEDAAPAVHVSVDRDAAMEKGWTVAQIYLEIASRLTGSTTAMTMSADSAEADVLVETGDQTTRRELVLMPFTYTDAEGNEKTFRLRDVAVIEDTVSLSSILRENQRRYLNVTAAVDEGHSVTQTTADAQKAVAALALPGDVSYEFSGENETTMEAVDQLLQMLLLGIVLVYFIMVAQFQSLKSPFIVMFTIPLAFTGGFLALLICGLDVSVIALIGFVMLTGVIVNNGIVLVDYVNQLRAAGMERREALAEAGTTRLRPILMTSLTTILGLIVMALGLDVGTMLMQPVAIVCIGGLAYATVMTLFVVPCMYDLVNKKEPDIVSEEDMDFTEN